MDRDATLLDLPVLAKVDGDDISVIYTSELRLVKTAEDLESFTKRWEALWRLPCGPDRRLHPNEESIVDNTYDKELALDCMAKCRGGACDHVQNKDSCPGAHIIMPYIMMQCFFIAHEYGAPFNVALVQLQKAFENLPDHVAFQVF